MSGIDLSTLNESQRRIATTLDEPLFVQAGAGSGKTFTLTRRVAWALSPGSGKDGQPFATSLDQVLVITFTNAAAREIKERVRTTLRDAGMYQQSLQVDSAWISTIHGMCSRILKRNALELGLDPNFTVCGTHRAAELLEEAVEQSVGAARRTAAPGSQVAEAFQEFEYGGVVSRVLALVQAAHASSEGFKSLEGPKLRGASEPVADVARAFEVLKAQKLTPAAQKKVLPALELLDAFLALPPSQRTTQQAAEVLQQVKLPAPAKAIAEARAAAQAELAHARALVALEQANQHVGALMELARATDACYAQLKRSQALLDNDDLISLALDAVRSDPTVEARYAGRFKLVMVDEFQDTDAQQLELITLLASSPEAFESEPRHLATVGDAQQSIYRFRGADVQVFNDRGARVPEAGQVRLDVNYRSHADVLALVDRVCGGPEGVLHDFMHLDANPKRDDSYQAKSLPRISVEVTSGPSRSGYASASQTLMLANQLADRLASYHAAGESAGGMALLLGSTTHADLYIDALRERGLECVVTGGSTFTRAPEVAVMLSLLRTLANPRDTQSGLFPLLSSPLFELDANDFLQLGSRAQQKLDAPTKRGIDQGLLSLDLFHGAQPSARLQHAHQVLLAAFDALRTRPVADVCLDVVRSSGWLQRLEAAGPEGVATEANVLAAVRYIRDLTQEMGLGPVRAASEFARWLEESKVPPASLAGAQQNTVRVMTIHASKGLEYPVVAVAECWNNPRREGGLWVHEETDGTSTVILAPKGGVKLEAMGEAGRASDAAQLAYDVCSENESADAQEKARLLYVALTRAREALVLGINAPCSKMGVSSKLAAGTLRALFGAMLPPEGESRVDYGGSEPAFVHHCVCEGAQPATGDEVGEEEAPADDGLHQVALYPAEDVWCDEVTLTRAREGVFSYSSALAGHNVVLPAAEPQKRATLPPRDQRDAQVAGEPAESDEDKATNLGSAFHMAAQVMVEVGGPCPPARVEALARRWGLSARQRSRLDAALDFWTNCDLRHEALGYGLMRAEVPFFARVEGEPYGQYGSYVEGAIDLLCTESAACRGHALVVDYKTGDVGLREDQVRARHAAQAQLYAHVLLGQGFESVTCAFVAVETGVVARWDF